LIAQINVNPESEPEPIERTQLFPVSEDILSIDKEFTKGQKMLISMPSRLPTPPPAKKTLTRRLSQTDIVPDQTQPAEAANPPERSGPPGKSGGCNIA